LRHGHGRHQGETDRQQGDRHQESLLFAVMPHSFFPFGYFVRFFAVTVPGTQGAINIIKIMSQETMSRSS
jgi:hypothetical protein